ncbi:GNAT family N-acetyltransferase [Synechococcus sp. PCC 6312]|uniref:GNAT family N-acetyltransferase n=1 Tax=Synechococcus sp. (strain ATCC 27167 / PCC 6312) TaxID=195253 RepID=UPI00029ECA7B|nr:GNAT family N-acetyltransferase [Synechococcus sp. PCC 6312]AFY60272.1 acetyltransferase (GNAT) family protein [Synechococcus sp. PCC 6312]
MTLYPGLPHGYSIRIAESYQDTWTVFLHQCLKREKEPGKTNDLSSQKKQSLALLWIVILGLGLLSALAINYILEEWIYLLWFVLIFIGSLTITYTLLLSWIFVEVVIKNYILIKKSKRRLLIVLYKHQFSGSILLESRRNYGVLLGLYVSPSHRKKGIGSCLVECGIRNIRTPIYVHAIKGTEDFYEKNNFTKSNDKPGYNMILKRSSISDGR